MQHSLRSLLRPILALALAAGATAGVRIEATAAVTNRSGTPTGAFANVGVGSDLQLSLVVDDVPNTGSTATSAVYSVVEDGSFVAIDGTLYAIEPGGTVSVDASATSAVLFADVDFTGGGAVTLALIDTQAPLLFGTTDIAQIAGAYATADTNSHTFNVGFGDGSFVTSLGFDRVDVVDATALVGSTYCVGVPNSTGEAGVLRASGSPVASANDLRLDAFDLPTGTFGIFVASRVQDFVVGPGGSQGNLCLGGGIGRFNGSGQILNSGASGTFGLVLDLNQLPTPNAFVPAVAGETWNFQAWFRDLDGGVPTSNFTGAVAVEFE